MNYLTFVFLGKSYTSQGTLSIQQSVSKNHASAMRSDNIRYVPTTTNNNKNNMTAKLCQQYCTNA